MPCYRLTEMTQDITASQPHPRTEICELATRPAGVVPTFHEIVVGFGELEFFRKSITQC